MKSDVLIFQKTYLINIISFARIPFKSRANKIKDILINTFTYILT